MKIISGKYRGRIIPTDQQSYYRPSTSKFREAVFSILASGTLPDDFTIKNARVLDIFAGTGSLGLEALSRGAKSVNFIDINQGHLDALGRFAAKIGASDCVEVFNLDANNLPYSDKNYNLVFMDPPYNSHYPQKLLLSLVANNWLEQGAVIVIEVASGQKVELGEHYALLKNKCYGNNQLLLLRYGKK